MSFSYISKISFYLSFVFIFSCQETILSLNKKDKIVNEQVNFELEKNDTFDLNYFENIENNALDIYSTQKSNYNFLDQDLNRLLVNNYEEKYNNSLPINIIYFEKFIYSINSKGDLLKFDTNSGKLIEKYTIQLNDLKQEPVSFSLYDNDFIIGYKSGVVIKINKLGKVIWMFENKNLLNTPIKILKEQLIVLYPDKIIFLEPSTGDIIYEKNFKSNKIIQSSGGKIENYHNILFFILSNSQFSALDSFLFEEHVFNFDQVELNTSLNNLKDQIHIYKNFLAYLDNGNILHTYDINNDQFILSNHIINNSFSAILFNNALISRNESFIEFYNIKNGNLFSKLNIKKILHKKSIFLKILIINNKIHLFTNNGEVMIIDKNFNINKIVDLKIKNINKIYSYQNKVFISTQRGTTYIY